jgi:hypothetical protein
MRVDAAVSRAAARRALQAQGQGFRQARRAASQRLRQGREDGYSAQLGFEIGAHVLLATAATNALDHQANIAKV